MTNPIDYSRPVGWWCPVCGGQERSSESITGLVLQLEAWCCVPTTPVISRFLPIPEGQRPPAASEVEEAEVVTYEWVTKRSKVRLWAADSDTLDTKTLNRINRANAIHIVTGATE